MSLALNPKQVHPQSLVHCPLFKTSESPIHYAVRHRNKAMLDKALQAGFSITEKDSNGLNAFDLAIQTNQLDTTAALADKIFGFNTKQLLVKIDYQKIAKELRFLERDCLAWKSKVAQTHKMTAAGLAAVNGDLQTLRTFHSEDFKKADQNGLTPLHYALLEGDENVVEFLKPHSDPSFVTPDGNTYLHFAAMSGHAKIIRSIQKLGIDSNSLNNNRCTPAHLFISAGKHPGKILSLINNRANLTIKNANGISPLAILYGRATPKTSGLITVQDTLLAITSILYVGSLFYSTYLLRNSASYSMFDSKRLLPAIVGVTSYLARQKIVSDLSLQPTTQFSWIKNPLAHCLFLGVTGFLSYMWNLRAPLIVTNASLQLETTSSVFENSKSGLKKCVQQFHEHPISALGSGAIHVLNSSLDLGSLAYASGVYSPFTRNG